MMTFTGRRMALVGLIMLVAVRPLEAAPPMQAMDLMPESTDRDNAQALIGRQVGKPVGLIPLDPLLVESIRWAAPNTAKQACDEESNRLMDNVAQLDLVPLPPSRRELIPTLSRQAGVQLERRDPAGALISIMAAYSLIPCAVDFISQEQLRGLFLTEALTRLAMRDPLARYPFMDMLGVDSRLSLEAYHPQWVKDAFNEAVKQFVSLPPLPLEPGTTVGELTLDGQPAANLKEVRPGRHVVQWKALRGELRSVLIQIQPGAPVKLAALPEWEMPSAEQAFLELLRGLAQVNLNRWQSQGIERYLVMRDRPVVYFALEVVGDRFPVLRTYKEGRGLVASNGDPMQPDPGIQPVPPRWASAATGPVAFNGQPSPPPLSPLAPVVAPSAFQPSAGQPQYAPPAQQANAQPYTPPAQQGNAQPYTPPAQQANAQPPASQPYAPPVAVATTSRPAGDTAQSGNRTSPPAASSTSSRSGATPPPKKKEPRPPRTAHERARQGSGLGLGLGFLYTVGATGRSASTLDGEGQTQTTVNDYRPSFAGTPFLELSTTFTSRSGFGLALRGRARPPVTIAGLDEPLAGSSSSVIPSFYGAALGLGGSWGGAMAIQAMVGGQAQYMTSMQYAADITTAVPGMEAFETGVFVPALGAGPEATVGVSTTFGKSRMQLGLVMHGGYTWYFPLLLDGSFPLADGSEADFELSDEKLTGIQLGAVLFFRATLF